MYEENRDFQNFYDTELQAAAELPCSIPVIDLINFIALTFVVIYLDGTCAMTTNDSHVWQ